MTVELQVRLKLSPRLLHMEREERMKLIRAALEEGTDPYGVHLEDLNEETDDG